ncbi:MAG: hypothetical protein H6710_21850 [Myxococcales bacterium]|nr:hypothetical protein [Myxococcales bacterium]
MPTPRPNAITPPDAGPARPWLRALWATFSLDRRSLAIFRIGVGLILLHDLIARLGHFGAFYTDAGILPRAALSDLLARSHAISLHAMVGDGPLLAALFAGAGAAALMLVVGWRTRLATIASFVLLASLHARAPYITNGGDTLLRCLLFWAIFLPLGDRLALDARRRPAAAAPRGPALGVASLAFCLQLALMYLVTALLKTGASWAEGSAVYYALSATSLAREPLAGLVIGTSPLVELVGPGPLALLRGLGLPIDGAVPWAASLLTYATLALEYLGPLLLLTPLPAALRGRVRGLLVALFVALHLGFAAGLEVGIFPIVCVVAWLALLPGACWERLGWRSDADEERPASTPAPTLTARFMPALRGLGGALLAAILLMVVHWNLRAVDATARVVPPMPSIERAAVEGLRLHQRWPMFAPNPLRDDGWWQIPGRLEGGGEVDLWSGEAPRWVALDTQERHRAALHPDDPTRELDRSERSRPRPELAGHRWYKVMRVVWSSKTVALRTYVARHLCRAWNATHRGPERLRDLQIVYMLERTPAPGEAVPPVEAVTMLRHSCGE